MEATPDESACPMAGREYTVTFSHYDGGDDVSSSVSGHFFVQARFVSKVYCCNIPD